jgi:hypothetical protein
MGINACNLNSFLLKALKSDDERESTSKEVPHWLQTILMDFLTGTKGMLSKKSTDKSVFQ